MINTKTVSDRRKLTFSSLDAVLADAQACARADSAGRLRTTGNWTLGQALGHLAFWIDGAYDGFPFKPPLLLRLLGPLMKRSVLKGGAVGVRIPGTPDGTYGTEKLSTAEGLRRLESAIRRLQAAPPDKPNPVFGKLKHEEWKRLHCAHAETHLSFMHPG
jgi:hypothetical protein